MADPQERSQSRGREIFSYGRGGLGNLRQASASGSRTRPDTVPSGPDDYSDSRGREPLTNSARLYSTGRGGAGNIRSPSRDPSKPRAPAPIDAAEQEIIQTHIAASQTEPVSSGRGGIGNISSRSRSRGPASIATNTVHSTGRGGAGNILIGQAGTAEILDETERKKLAASGNDSPALHSTGRGGAANYVAGREPSVEKVVHTSGVAASTGRGGAGNIKYNN